ncbi:hypothetical protein H6G80_30595 [Nostoc sp. FACHB-87]|uniref:hypothetical protein n=1 Tax=Nostocaceae TaxID=1162 RepID=UPI001685669D|nr:MULTISPECIES: hypothetical protein [Nostocaceae]MBD2458403.1 hypothetical protein [Nostoc sp. FACHB-87]
MPVSEPPTEQKNALEQLMEQKGWSYYQLAVEYGRLEHPDLSPAELAKKFGTNVRKAVRDPNSARFETVKKLVELLGGELIIRVKRIDEMPL